MRSATYLGELVVEMKFNDSNEYRVAREKMLIILEKDSEVSKSIACIIILRRL